MKKFLFFLCILLSLGAISACSSAEDNSIQKEVLPEGWSLGPDGIFTLKIVDEESVANTYKTLLGAIIVTSPNDLTPPIETSLFSKNRKIMFESTDIPIDEREIGYTFQARILGYYQISDPYETIVIICKIRKL